MIGSALSRDAQAMTSAPGVWSFSGINACLDLGTELRAPRRDPGLMESRVVPSPSPRPSPPRRGRNFRRLELARTLVDLGDGREDERAAPLRRNSARSSECRVEVRDPRTTRKAGDELPLRWGEGEGCVRSKPGPTSIERFAVRDPTCSQISKPPSSCLAGLGRVAILVATIFLAGCGPRAIAPPTVPTESLDPAAVEVLRRSREAVIAAPKSAEAWGRLGGAFHAGDFFGEARLCYGRAVELDPGSPRWLHLLGLLQLQDQPDEAIRNLALAAERAGVRPDAPRVRLVQALVERGRYEEADAPIRWLLAVDPGHAAARLESARIHLARHELDRASVALEPCLTNAHTMRSAMLLLAQVRQRQGDGAAAAELSRRGASMPRPFDWPDPFVREVQRLRAGRQELQDQINGLLMQQRLKEAETALSRLLTAFPEDPEGLLLLGRLRTMERKCAESEEALRRHLAVQPNSLNGLVQLALALLCQQRWADATVILRQAIALKPDFAQAHYNLGHALARAGDSAGAIRSYGDALRSSPGDFNAHLALAEELFLIGQRAEALLHLNRASELNPGNPRVKDLRDRFQTER
jgi:tetratricopeptide (TPR) repeat protein